MLFRSGILPGHPCLLEQRGRPEGVCRVAGRAGSSCKQRKTGPDGPGRFTQNSSCSALLRIPLGFAWLRIRSCHALWLYFPEHSAHQLSCHGVVLQPHPCRNMDGLGCSPFARHYWGNHCLFSFPAGTKMFQFPALASNNVG